MGFIEKLERDPARFLPDLSDQNEDEVVAIDLNKPMNEILAALSQHPVETRLALSGPLIVARDIAHAKLLERLESEGNLPDYFKEHPVYYARDQQKRAGRFAVRLIWANHGGKDGFICPHISSRGWI